MLALVKANNCLNNNFLYKNSRLFKNLKHLKFTKIPDYLKTKNIVVLKKIISQFSLIIYQLQDNENLYKSVTDV